MLVTADNWDSVKKKLLPLGIERDGVVPDGTLPAILTKEGSQVVFTEHVFHSLTTGALLHPGIRADSIRELWDLSSLRYRLTLAQVNGQPLSLRVTQLR